MGLASAPLAGSLRYWHWSRWVAKLAGDAAARGSSLIFFKLPPKRGSEASLSRKITDSERARAEAFAILPTERRQSLLKGDRMRRAVLHGEA